MPGRPKTLDKQKIIAVAFKAYWQAGINNVSISDIARISGVSRAGIYKEFCDEDGLKSEVILLHISLLGETTLNMYNKYYDGPEAIFWHVESILTSTPYKKLLEYSTLINEKNIVPKGAKGCLFEKFRLNNINLDKKSQNIIKKFRTKRIKILKKFISINISNNTMKCDLDSTIAADFIDSQLLLTQTMSENNIHSDKIRNVVHFSLSSLCPKNYKIQL